MKNKHSLVKKKNRLMKQLFAFPPLSTEAKKIAKRVFAIEAKLDVPKHKRIQL